MSLSNTPQPHDFAWNRQVYQRLKLALSIGLRRQIFIAVCDDLNLRNKVAARLHSNLASPVEPVLHQSGEEASTPAYPRLVTLRLNLSDPNPVTQINQWLIKYPPPVVGASADTPGRPLPIPSFQIVGIEQLTRQPVATQRLFLQNLRLIEKHLSNPKSNYFIESNLLLWLPRPWLYAIKQSAPLFWCCRTGVFVFAGEPTPTNHQQGTPERFSNSRGVDVNTIERSILEESVFVEDFDFPNSTPVNRGHQEEEITPTPQETQEEITPPTSKLVPPETPQEAENDTPTQFPASINKELAELVLATINNSVPDSPENQQQIENLLHIIEELHSQQESVADLATAYQNLGDLYRLRIEAGDSTLENIMVAILAYQEAITYDETSPQIPDVLNDLGTLYWMLYRTPPNSEEGQIYIEQGIEFYHLALKMISPQTHPEVYSRVQNNLGTAYGDLANFYQPQKSWELAIAAYQEALRYRTEEMQPEKYAACHNNLGTAYWHLAQYNEPVIHLQKAIASYSTSLQYYSAQAEPLKYGMIQNNIGTAYWNLAQYENPGTNLLLAIDAYNQALKYRTPANAPVACSSTQNNLGTAYWHLANLNQTPQSERQNYLKLGIKAYEESLALAHSLPGATFSFDVFVTHNNLALAHHQLATIPYFPGDKQSRSRHLEAALENHLQALNGLSKQPEAYEITFSYIVKTIRSFHNELGIQGQNLALSKVPSHLLADILPKL